jgi:hypothetical protein
MSDNIFFEICEVQSGYMVDKRESLPLMYFCINMDAYPNQFCNVSEYMRDYDFNESFPVVTNYANRHKFNNNNYIFSSKGNDTQYLKAQAPAKEARMPGCDEYSPATVHCRTLYMYSLQTLIRAFP